MTTEKKIEKIFSVNAETTELVLNYGEHSFYFIDCSYQSEDFFINILELVLTLEKFEKQFCTSFRDEPGWYQLFCHQHYMNLYEITCIFMYNDDENTSDIPDRYARYIVDRELLMKELAVFLLNFRKNKLRMTAVTSVTGFSPEDTAKIKKQEQAKNLQEATNSYSRLKKKIEQYREKLEYIRDQY